MGTHKDLNARIYVDLEAKPQYCKARSVPYAMRQMVEDELARLVEEGTLEPVLFASWAALYCKRWKAGCSLGTRLDKIIVL